MIDGVENSKNNEVDFEYERIEKPRDLNERKRNEKKKYDCKY